MLNKAYLGPNTGGRPGHIPVWKLWVWHLLGNSLLELILTQNIFSQSRSKLFTMQRWKGQALLFSLLQMPSPTTLSTSTWLKTFWNENSTVIATAIGYKNSVLWDVSRTYLSYLLLHLEMNLPVLVDFNFSVCRRFCHVLCSQCRTRVLYFRSVLQKHTGPCIVIII